MARPQPVWRSRAAQFAVGGSLNAWQKGPVTKRDATRRLLWNGRPVGQKLPRLPTLLGCDRDAEMARQTDLPLGVPRLRLAIGVLAFGGAFG